MTLRAFSPNFAVSDIRKSVAFYKENFGFNLVMGVPVSQDSVDTDFIEGKEYVYAMINKDNISLMFQKDDSFYDDIILADRCQIGASVSFYFDVEDLDELYESLQNKKLNMTEIKMTWYGQREFYIKDNNGYILCFAKQAE
ncbi:MAG: VOC family protein [Campylobacteraceae bacterium]|jgi:uncharacterized glyoxalase superfamily protein PhnB|nr:VOC family protein [Campylobacteraceae bacterium]